MYMPQVGSIFVQCFDSEKAIILLSIIAACSAVTAGCCIGFLIQGYRGK